MLAYAGLKRLGLAHRATALLDIDDFLPAVGQGAIGSPRAPATPRGGGAGADLRRADRSRARGERAFLAVLEAPAARRSPATPARRGALEFRGLVLRADGSEAFEVAAHGASPTPPLGAAA